MRIISKVVSFFAGSFESYLSASEIKEFVLKNFYQLNIGLKKDERIDSEFIELKSNLAILSWIEQEDPERSEMKNAGEDDRSNVYQWFNNLKNNKIISQGIIAKGSGENLDWLDERNEDLNGFIASALESILRIVEVKRKKILRAFSQDLAGDEKIREGLRISILLSRASRRHDDLRYLNAAFKMNDWYYSVIRSAASENSLIYYLLALTEQEKSAAELLQ